MFAGLAVVVLLGAGCETFKESRGRGDAPIGTVDDEEVDIYQMPDRFPGIGTKCVGDGFRVFVTDRTDNHHDLEIVEDETCV